jgi:hypothetical protein
MFSDVGGLPCSTFENIGVRWCYRPQPRRASPRSCAPRRHVSSEDAEIEIISSFLDIGLGRLMSTRIKVCVVSLQILALKRFATTPSCRCCWCCNTERNSIDSNSTVRNNATWENTLCTPRPETYTRKFPRCDHLVTADQR